MRPECRMLAKARSPSMRRALESPITWALLRVVAQSSGLFLVAAQDSCAAGDASARCNAARGTKAAVTNDGFARTSKADAEQQSVIAQELQELEGLLELNEQRITLLERLQQAVDAGDLNISETQAQALRAEIPKVADVAVQPHLLPAAAPEDYITSKAVIRMEDRATLIKFLPLRASPTYSSKEDPLAPPPALLVATGPGGRLAFYASSGELLLLYEAGHDMDVTHLAVSPTWAKGDMLVATGDVSGVVRVHRVTARQRKGVVPRSADVASLQNDTLYLGTTVAVSVNVTVQFQRQLEALAGVDGDIPQMTALAMASQQGSKYFVIGDAEGKISVFTLAGAFRSRMDATFAPGHGIDSFYVHMSQLLFRAGPEWGYIDLENLEVKHIECPDFEGNQITAAIIDSQYSQRVLAADEHGTLWSFVVRHARSCRVERKFPSDISQAPLDLASIRGFVLALQYGRTLGSPTTLMALNLSYIREKEETDGRPVRSPIVWRRDSRPVLTWAVYRHRSDGPASDLVALLSKDGMEVEILELLMTLKIVDTGQPFWLNGWITLPVIITLVLSAVFWHYLKYGRTMSSSASGGTDGGSGSPEGAPGDGGMPGMPGGMPGMPGMPGM